jgi:hypothetical protein
VPTALKIPKEDVVPFKVNFLKSIQRTISNVSVPSLIKDHKAALFHPEHGVVIANANDSDVQYKNP